MDPPDTESTPSEEDSDLRFSWSRGKIWACDLRVMRLDLRVGFGCHRSSSEQGISLSHTGHRIAPAEGAGWHNVFVTTPGGTSPAVTADQFTYVLTLPVVSSLSQASGPTAGGTTVTIKGTGFSGATQVLFGTVPATSFSVSSSTRITAVAPAEAAGTVDVVVTTTNGSSTTSSDDQFTYRNRSH
jgi:IPT/TIG domain